MIIRSTFAAAAALSLLAGAAGAAEKSFSDLISDSIGYVQVRENVLIVEDDYNQYLCHVNVSDTLFDDFAAGKALKGGDFSTTCIPFEELED